MKLKKKRLREEPLGMSTQQKFECLASAVGTQFKDSVLSEETHSNTKNFNHKPKVGKEKNPKNL